MPQYRLLANSAYVGDKFEIRAKRGDMVELTEQKAQQFLEKGLVVEPGKETDAQKAEFEAMDKRKEHEEAIRREIQEAEKQVASQAGDPDNKTVVRSASSLVTANVSGTDASNPENAKATPATQSNAPKAPASATPNK